MIVAPTFFVVGAAKSGTTWLYDQLRAHPSVFLPATKEPHHFAYLAEPELVGDLHPSRAVAERTYTDLYDNAASYTAVGDMSNSNLVTPGAAAAIADAVPDARIVAVLRHPVDRAFSQFNHFVSAGGETTNDFGHAVRDEERRLASGEFPFTYGYLRWGRYDAQLPPYLERFGDRVLILLYDDLLADPGGFVDRITDFLGVGRHPGPLSEARVNRVEVPARRRSGWRRLVGATRAPVGPVRLDPGLRAALTIELRASILATQEIVGRDLSAWLTQP